MARTPTSQYAPVQPAVHRSNHEDRHLPNGPDELNWSGAIHMSGTAANRPTAGATNKGALYFATDTGLLYRSDGATWTQVGGTSATPSGSAGGALDGTYPNPGLAASVAGAGLAETTDVLSVNATAPLGITSDAVAFNTGYKATFAGTSAPTTPSPAQGDLWYDTAFKTLNLYSGAAWMTITPQSATVATDQTTASTSYANLATVGPAVTVATGTSALVTISATVYSDTADHIYMSLAVSSATTLAAADARATHHVAVGDEQQVARTFPITGLTAGSNTFTAKYRGAGGSTNHWFNRDITVQSIPT